MIKNLEINIATGEVNEVVMSEKDIKTLAELDTEALAAKTEAEAAKAHEKAALLAKLGITEDEAKLLLS